MIKKITKTVMKEVQEVVSEVIVCDVCGKELNYDTSLGTSKVASYYEIMTGHRDWGNDSCESIKHRQVCCNECLSRFTQDWLKDPEVIGSNTAYIEIEKDRHWFSEALEMAIEALEERPKGKWVEKEETPASVSYYCSNCECAGLGVENFCSWCGADMRGKEK